MARNESRTQTAIWRNPDFTALSIRAQRMYWVLYSQPTISLCGVVPYTPKRWAGYASDETVESVIEALGELEAASFILSDPATEEVLVRSFMRSDGVTPGNPKVWRPAMEQFEAVLSPRIRAAIEIEVARITNPQVDGASDTPPIGDGMGHGMGPAGARLAPAPTPAPSPAPVTPLTPHDVGGAKPPANSRIHGTSPRAVEAKKAEAAKRIEALNAAAAYGRRMAPDVDDEDVIRAQFRHDAELADMAAGAWVTERVTA